MPGLLALVAMSALTFLVPGLSFAQATTPAPPRETPRPQDIDPAVDTSRPAASETAPARATPRPQDINPGVDTSATAPSGNTSPAPAPSANTSSSGNAAARKPSPSNGATGAAATPGATAPTAAGLQPGGATRTQAKGRSKALDRLELDTTQITGNRELPKVLYIVPWKRADLGDLLGKPVNSLLDEVLTPVDRDVFKRENRYYRALMPEGAQPAGASGSTAAPPSDASSAGGTAVPGAKDER